MPKAKHNLEHQVWAQAKELNIVGRKCIIACSGGSDSVALARVFAQIWSKDNLIVAHYHHGPAENRLHRDSAQVFVQKLCQNLGLEFLCDSNTQFNLRSEHDLRYLRRAFFEKIRQQKRFDLIVQGHHLNDLLETRLIRLIRGTGLQGLNAISNLRDTIWRPFLGVEKENLKSYLNSISQVYIEDPTNSTSSNLRNWIRNEWLPQLEQVRNGAVAAFGESIQRILASQSMSSVSNSPQILRQTWLTYSREQRQQWVAQQLLSMGVKSYTQGQIKEVVKQLDKTEKRYTFELANSKWSVDPLYIEISSRRKKVGP
jgi:tRNA(Ile)-lysidine synthase